MYRFCRENVSFPIPNLYNSFQLYVNCFKPQPHSGPDLPCTHKGLLLNLCLLEFEEYSLCCECHHIFQEVPSLTLSLCIGHLWVPCHIFPLWDFLSPHGALDWVWWQRCINEGGTFWGLASYPFLSWNTSPSQEPSQEHWLGNFSWGHLLLFLYQNLNSFRHLF